MVINYTIDRNVHLYLQLDYNGCQDIRCTIKMKLEQRLKHENKVS